MHRIITKASVILISIVLPFFFSLHAQAYFEDVQLIGAGNCPVLDEPEELALLSSFDISENGLIAVASTDGFVMIYDQDMQFLKCINAGSQDIFVLWEHDDLLIYSWKIDQFVEFSKDFSEQATYEIPLTPENREKIYALEVKNTVRYKDADYHLTSQFGNGYMYLKKKDVHSNEIETLIDRSSKANSDLMVIVLFLILFIVMGISIVLYHVNGKEKEHPPVP